MMSVSWTSRIAWPGSRQDCQHPPCRRLTRWSTAVIISAVAAEFGLGIAFPADGVPAVITAAVIFAAGTVLACWPHPAEAGLEAFDTAVREPRLPAAWTAADWADLDKELNG